MNFEWSLHHGNDQEWSELLDLFSCNTYLQDSAWSNVMSEEKWVIKRWVCMEAGSPVALIQSFLKVYPFKVGIVWIPDWILGDYKYGLNFDKFLSQNLKLNFLYLRFRSNHSYNSNEHILLLTQGWVQPSKKLSSSLNMELSLIPSIEEIESGASKNWKRNLMRSRRSESIICRVTDPEIIVSMYEELQSIKNIKVGFSKRQIRNIVKFYKDQLVVFGAKDEFGNFIAIRGAIIYQDKAIDIFAATTKKSRKIYTSYNLFIHLVAFCKSCGCVSYDLNGVDPVVNIGVYNFKKGTGASLESQLGEFEGFNSKFLGYIINLYLK